MSLGVVRLRVAWLRWLAAAAVACVALVGGAVPAYAAVPPNLIGYSEPTGYLGTFRPAPFSSQVICIDAHQDDPTIITTPASLADWPQGAYLMSVYGQTSSRVDGAALAYIVKSQLDSNPSYAEATLVAIGNNRGAALEAQIRGRVAAMLAEAAQNAGPYDAGQLHLQVTTPVPTAGQVTGVGVQSAAGAWLAGYPVTVTLDGPAVFDATGTSVWTGTTGSSALSLPWHATGATAPGQLITVRQRIDGLPGSEYNVYPAQGPGYQRVTTAGPMAVSYADPVGVAGTITYSPAGTTKTSMAVVQVGAAVHDVVTGSGYAPGAAGTGSAVLYGPLSAEPVPGAAVPAGTPVVGTAPFAFTADAAGAFSAPTSDLTIPAVGFYAWVAKTDAAENINGWTASWGEASETLVAIEPGITTAISTQSALTGQEISDTAIPSGIVASVGGQPITSTITGGIYGPLAPKTGLTGVAACEGLDWTGAPSASTIAATTVTTNDPVKGLGKVTSKAPGCYSAGETLTVTFGGQVVAVVEHPVGHVTQTVLVTTPTMGTVAVTADGKPATVVPAGTTVYDDIIVKDSAGQPGKIVAQAWIMPAPSGATCTAITRDMWEKAIADGTAKAGTDAMTIPITGDGTVRTPAGYTIGADECGTWVEKATWPSAPGLTVITPPGEPTETTLGLKVTVSTVARADGEQAGAGMTDLITIGGTHGVPGTLTGDLLALTGTCPASPDWAAVKVIGSMSPITTGADGLYVSSSVSTPRGGALCTTWEVTWTPTDPALAALTVTHARGQAEETIPLTASGAGGGGLAQTGADHVLPMAGSAGGLLLAGLVLVMTARRRRETV